MEIDEVNLASPQLQDLIDSKVAAKLKKIEAKLARIPTRTQVNHLPIPTQNQRLFSKQEQAPTILHNQPHP